MLMVKLGMQLIGTNLELYFDHEPLLRNSKSVLMTLPLHPHQASSILAVGLLQSLQNLNSGLLT